VYVYYSVRVRSTVFEQEKLGRLAGPTSDRSHICGDDNMEGTDPSLFALLGTEVAAIVDTHIHAPYMSRDPWIRSTYSVYT
jgi:hypothetical protein